MSVETMECIRNMWWGIVLGVGSFMDIRKKSLPRAFITTVCVISVVLLMLGYLLSVSCISYMQAGVGAVIGSTVLVASLFSDGCIGMADAVLTFLTGLLFGYIGSIEILMYAIFFAAIISIILITFGKADRKSHIPFVPFMFLGYVLYSLRNI